MAPVIAKDNIQLTLLPQKKGKTIAIFLHFFKTLSHGGFAYSVGHSSWCEHKGTHRE
jgi:hypothetical protein